MRVLDESTDEAALALKLNQRWWWFLSLFAVPIIGSYSFLNYWEYSQEFHSDPNVWVRMLHGHGTAPQQYRVGVLFVASFLSWLSRGHLAIRHGLGLLDFVFLIVGMSATFFLVTQTRFYRESSLVRRCATQLLATLLLLFYLSWTFWYHKPETIANFASLSVAAVLLSGKLRIRPAAAGAGLILVSIYLGTIRADAGVALNLGILLVALLPGGKTLPLGRTLQGLVGGIGLVAVLAVESYIKYIVYPGNPFSDPLFELVRNLKSPIALYCVVFSLAPYFLVVMLARRRWKTLEAWESALLVASFVELTLFLIVARADEVRLFLPYPMALLPTSAALLGFELTRAPSPRGEPAAAQELPQ
jgi:hypothetical protein